MAHISLKLKDFIREGSDGRKYITTKALPEAIQKFAASARRHAAHIKSILEKVSFYAMRHCGDKFKDADGNFSATPISPEISMSIIALGTTLDAVARNFFGTPHFGNYLSLEWPPSLLLRERLQRAGWCPRDISQFEADGSTDCVYYFSSMTSPRKGQDHSRCTAGVCYGGNVDQRLTRPHMPVNIQIFRVVHMWKRTELWTLLRIMEFLLCVGKELRKINLDLSK